MRPPDENQDGSMRPNLLSSGRGRFGGDDNILERLERDSARHASGNRSRAAWYAAAASLVLLVLVVVAWMAYDNASTVHVIPMTKVPADSVAPQALATPSQPLPLPLPSQARIQAATVSVMSPEAPETLDKVATAPHRDHAAGLPPLVLLPENDVGAKVATPPAAVATPPRPPSQVRPRPVADEPPAIQQRNASRPVAAPKPRKPATGQSADDALVDRDVALLSAIIIHDSAHAEEKAQLEAASACARDRDRKCLMRPSTGTVSKN